MAVRVYGALFAFLPILLFFLPEIATYLDKLSVVGLYVCWFVCAAIGLGCIAVWVRFVPTVLSLALGVLAWIGLAVLIVRKILS
ncbi:MAG: hypothetical protein ACREFR_18755 [Limisphaerales bacterium]